MLPHFTIGRAVLLCCFIFPVRTDAQYVFEQSLLLDKEKGLPSDYVVAICKDPDGFVWMGTTDGVCRFDGTHVKTYRNDPADSTSLIDNQVTDVKPFGNNIWVATNMGFSVLDPRTEKCANYQVGPNGVIAGRRREPKQCVNVLFADPYGDLWIGTQSYGVVRYRPQQHDFQIFTYKPAPAGMARANWIMSFTASVTNDSIIYAGTPAGLLEINRITGRVFRYEFPQATNELSLAANAFRRVYCHDDGLLYAGSWRAGIHVFDPVRKTFVPLPLKTRSGIKILQSGIEGLARKNAGEIWITTGAGLAVYHTARREMVFLKENDLKEGKYYGVDMIDEKNRVWFAAINGVHIFDPALQQFPGFGFAHLRRPGWSYVFYIATGLSEKELLVLPRSDDAVYHFDLASHGWQRFPLNVRGRRTPASWITRGLSRAPDGTFTISAEHGLFSYSPVTHAVRPMAYRPPLRYHRYGDVLWDKSGRFWLCAKEEGVVCWNPRARTSRRFFRELEPQDEDAFAMDAREPLEDSRGHIWFIREDGFSVFVPERDTMMNFLHERSPENTFSVIRSLVEDAQGRLWMSDNDGWVGYADVSRPELGLVKKINLRAGYDLGEVYKMAADAKGDIWGYTAKKLLRIDVSSLEISLFGFEYGGNPVDYYAFQFIPGGKLVLGGRNKIVLFDPKNARPNPEIPAPYVEEVRLQGKTLQILPPAEGRTALDFRYWENFFSVSFSAKAYTLGNECRFRYRLYGFDDWTESDDRRYANYTNVPGGSYVFQVQVANNEGVWNDAPLELPVRIQTAWWAAWWFRLAASVAFLSLGYAVYRYRVVQIRRQERLRTEFEKQLANVEMSALLAQMNPHFLFNCLNSIDSYIIRNESAKASEYLNNFARLMRLILNNSRSNYITLKDELESLDLYLQMENLRFRDKFRYQIGVGDQLDAAMVTIPPMLIQPYVENAIWHGLMPKDGTDGKLTIRIAKQDDDLVCTIEDNGIGRARAMELGGGRDNNRKSMGMQITEDRIGIINKLYGSNMRVRITDLYDEAGAPAGTRVTLTIPL